MNGHLSGQAGLQIEFCCCTIKHLSRPPNRVRLIRRHILPFIESSFLSLFCVDILDPHTFEPLEHGGIGCWKIRSRSCLHLLFEEHRPGLGYGVRRVSLYQGHLPLPQLWGCDEGCEAKALPAWVSADGTRARNAITRIQVLAWIKDLLVGSENASGHGKTK